MPSDPPDEDPAGHPGAALGALEALLDVLGPFTGEQPVHAGMWDGWGWWYDSGADPRTNAAMGLGLAWPVGEPRPTQGEIDRLLADTREHVAAELVERPDLGRPQASEWVPIPLVDGAAAAVSRDRFRHQPQDPPSLIWPEDRSWFVGAPIYTNGIAIAWREVVVDAAIADPRLSVRRVTVDDDLDIDDCLISCWIEARRSSSALARCGTAFDEKQQPSPREMDSITLLL